MWVVLLPSAGVFVRINTRGWREGSIRIAKSDHPWLDHDSYIECGSPLDGDEYLVEQALNRRGVIGSVTATALRELLPVIEASELWSAADKMEVRRAFAAAGIVC